MNAPNSLKQIEKNIAQAMAIGDYATIAKEALRAHQLLPNEPTPLLDACKAFIKTQDWDNAIQYGLKLQAKYPKMLESYDILAHAYGVKEDWTNTQKYGLQSLKIRDELAMKKITKIPQLVEIQPKKGKKIIAFSLFGASSAYIEPAILNTQLVQSIYPNWVARFYVDDSVPQEALQRLKQNGAEIILIKPPHNQLLGTMWRFLALNDEDAERIIFRDADSVISQREALAVAEWEASGRRFHIMRDAGAHVELILAGMWGAMANSIPNIEALLFDYINKGVKDAHFADQFFLREILWPSIRQDVLTHDNIFGFWDAQKYPEAPINYELTHIGQDESILFQIKSDLPNHTPVSWTLFSQIKPELNLDYSINLFSESRKICTYATTVQNGLISGYIPRRYYRGLKDNFSQIQINRPEMPKLSVWQLMKNLFKQMG